LAVVSIAGDKSPLFAQTSGGPVAYRGYQYQLVIGLPAGWSAYDQNRLNGMGLTPFGILIFMPLDWEPGQPADPLRPLRKMAAGETPYFFVDRAPADRGTSCAGFSAAATKRVTALVEGGPGFGRGRTVVRRPTAEPVTVHGCQGLRFRAETRSSNGGEEMHIDVHAFSDGKVSYLFAVAAPKELFGSSFPAYEAAMQTLNLTACGGVVLEGVDHQAATSRWKLASEGNIGDQQIVEFIPQSHRENDWSQIFTVHSVAETAQGLGTVLEGKRAGLARTCEKVDLETIDQSEASLVYEMRSTRCGKIPAEHEIGRLLLGSDAIHDVSFISKEKDWPATDRAQYLALLSGVRLQRTPSP
jgi:hypothetical protein